VAPFTGPMPIIGRQIAFLAPLLLPTLLSFFISFSRLLKFPLDSVSSEAANKGARKSSQSSRFLVLPVLTRLGPVMLVFPRSLVVSRTGRGLAGFVSNEATHNGAEDADAKS